METARSLRTRAILALALMVGFYVFALAIAAALLSVPYLEFMYLKRANVQITLAAIVGGVTILWAIMPRIDKFTPPGPALTPSNAPQLFTMINDVAARTSQERPEHVYLLDDVNAFVTHRGGFMGFGSKRVMGIGLPLIKGLAPGELRSVIAHEFGHYVSGDVALGPWIHKTRAAIGRTVTDLAERKSVLVHVFNWYALMFMRMTTQISREQEFVADATAARVAGKASTISALKRVEVIAPAYATYINQEVSPVLNAGYLPPITEGFDQYLNDPDTSRVFQEIATEMSLHAEAGEFDTHPPMRDRIAAVERIASSPEDVKDAAVSLLLKDPDRHARALLEHNLGRDSVAQLKTIGWTEVGGKVYAQVWEQVTKKNSKWLSTLTADQIPCDKTWFTQKGRELTRLMEQAPDEYRVAYAVHVLVCAIGGVMLQHDWKMETAPGKPIVLTKNGTRINLRETLTKLADGTLTPDEWKTTCRSIGVEAVPLAMQLN